MDIKRILNELRELQSIKNEASKKMDEIVESLNPVSKVEIGKYYINLSNTLYIAVYKIIGIARKFDEDEIYYDCLKIEIDKRLGDRSDFMISRTSDCIYNVVEITEEDFNNFLNYVKEQL